MINAGKDEVDTILGSLWLSQQDNSGNHDIAEEVGRDCSATDGSQLRNCTAAAGAVALKAQQDLWIGIRKTATSRNDNFSPDTLSFLSPHLSHSDQAWRATQLDLVDLLNYSESIFHTIL